VSRSDRIEEYALIGDGHAAALVHRDGAVDWCCLPRLDDGSIFGRLLDPERGGHCATGPVAPAAPPQRAYLDRTLVLCTTFTAERGRARVLDLLTVRADDPARPYGQLVRVMEGLEGTVDLDVEIAPRFDYGAASPWVHRAPRGGWYAIAGDDGLVIACEGRLEARGDHDLRGRVRLRAGERARLEIAFVRPERLDGDDPPAPCPPEELDRRLEATVDWWRDWAARAQLPDVDGEGVLRSALVLKALANPRTGAIAAAATTSLPESDESRTWDYRYSWVRDSVFSVRSLAELGFEDAADAFRRFIQRSAAGSADELRIMYGVGGERRIPEQELDTLRGWRGIGPVRAGNGAVVQRQLDTLGELLELSWRWHCRGHAPDDDLWHFASSLVERAAEEWAEPDAGLWEWRGEPRHFVFSKVMCWVALDRGIRLARDTRRDAPFERWERARDAVRAAIEEHGPDERGVFHQAFGGEDLDAAVLRLPSVGFLDADDERMLATTDAIMERLGDDGLVRRHDADDGQPGREGAFLACAFWLVEVLVAQGRHEEARERFERALQTRNDLWLFAEEFDTRAGEMRGNFPQALTHLSHILAAMALAVRERTAPAAAPTGAG
jgi:GH15 family glucan-1,4-alpha-glucosidase